MNESYKYAAQVVWLDESLSIDDRIILLTAMHKIEPLESISAMIRALESRKKQ